MVGHSKFLNKTLNSVVWTQTIGFDLPQLIQIRMQKCNELLTFQYFASWNWEQLLLLFLA